VNAWDLDPSPLRAVRKDRLFRRIADQLALLIASGEFEPGQRLPAERDLARQFGVSRPSVREALISLEVEGTVEARNGSGVFVVCDRPFAAHALSGGDHAPLVVLRARRLVEGEVAAMAARARNLLDLVAIRQALGPMEDLTRNAGFGDTPDRTFHLAVAAATHNDAMVAVVSDLCGPRRNRLRERSIVRHWAPALRAANLVDHRAIVEAIEARDRRGARAAMRRVLDRSIWVATLTQLATARAKSGPPRPSAADLSPADG
jgi:DNA-binding FadR family transcriptional regulator